MWRKRVRAGGTAADRGVDTFHMRDFSQQQTRRFRRIPGLRQCGAGWQLQVDLGLGVVIGRNEALGQQRDQHQGADKKRRCGAHGEPAVL